MKPSDTHETNEASRRRARWMAEAQQGNAAAYAELLNDVGPIIVNFLRRRVRDPDDAEDLYQELFLAVHRARHTYEPDRPLEPWLFAIARHVVADHERRRVVRGTRELVGATPPEPSMDGEGHLRLHLEQALRHLSPDQREAIDLLRVEGLPIDVAATRAGTTTGALKVRAHRAYKVLRQLI